MNLFILNSKNALAWAYKGKFDNETIRYAEIAIKLPESGKELNAKNFGALDHNSKIIAERNILLDRAIDAYARAYDFTKNKPGFNETNQKEFSDKLQELLKLRNKDKIPVDLEKLISAIIRKPLPDPSK